MALDAELLMAAAGMGRWLRPGLARYTQEHRKAAMRIPERIADAWRDFFTGGPKGDPDLPELDWPQVRDGLTTDPDEEFGTDHTAGLEDDEIFDQVDLAASCRAYLVSVAPLRAVPTPLGPEPAEPAYSEMLDFRRIYGVVDKPMTLLEDEMLAGSITRQQSEAVEQCYPELFALMKEGALNALVAIRAAREDYTLGRRRVRLMEIFLRRPSDSPSSIPEQLQEIDRPDKPPQDTAGAVELPQIQTVAQRLEQK